MRFLDAVALALDFRHVAHVDAQARSGVRILGHREGQFIMCLLRRSQDTLAGISVIIAAVQLDANLHIPFHRAAHIPAEHIGHTLDQLEPVVERLDGVFHLADVLDVHLELTVHNAQLGSAAALLIELDIQRSFEIKPGEQFLPGFLFRFRAGGRRKHQRGYQQQA